MVNEVVVMPRVIRILTYPSSRCVGVWHGPVPLPPRREIKSLRTYLSGEDKDKFLDFLSGVLAWLPEDRLNSFQAYVHP
jgi:hypothetical protein